MAVELVIVGTVALDNIRTPYGEVVSELGGSAVHSSVAASFFTNVGIVSIIGQDFPDEHVDFLLKRGISIEGIERNNGNTFRWHGHYEADMNQAQTLRTELNVLQEFNPILPEEYRKAEYLFLANIDPNIQIDVIKQMENPELIVMDTMNLWIETQKQKVFDAIELCDIMLLNDAEAKQLFETHNTIHAGRTLIKMGLRAAIIKKGEHGALLFTKDGIFAAPAYPLDNLKDPTGAGDSFAGGFIGWLAKTKDLSSKNMKKAIIYGTAVASFNTQGFGLNNLRTIMLTDIEKRCDELRELVEF